MSEQKQLTLTQRLTGDNFKNRLAVVAPQGFQVDRYVTMALDQIRGNLKNGKGLHPMSVLNSVYSAGSMGLSFNPAAKEAYLVPFGAVCTLIPGYKGLMKLCKNAGMEKMSAKVIYNDDQFTFDEVDGEVNYSYTPSFNEDRGHPICVLTVAYMDDGTKDIRVLPYHKVLKIKKAAKSKNIWNSYEEEMAMKTAIRKHCNQLPQSFDDPNLQQAIKIDEMFEANKPILETPEALRDMEDDDYQEVVDSINNQDQPQSSKPEVNINDIQEIEEATIVEEEKEEVKKDGETNTQKILKFVKITEEELKAVVEAELGFKNINKLSQAKVSEILDYFMKDGE
jgi:recombination protein RecT